MKLKQVLAVLMLAGIWAGTCGFSNNDSIAFSAGIESDFSCLSTEDVEELNILQEWDQKIMADVEEYVTIREQADESSEAVGRLYKGGSGTILEEGEEWTKISSGGCEGYVKNEYVASGFEAKEVADRDCEYTATVTGDALKVREEPSEEGKIITTVSSGEKYIVTNEEDGWVEVEYDSGSTGYVSADYVEVQFEIGQAQSIEEIEAKEAEERAKQEAAAREEAEKKAKLTANNGAVQANTDDVTLLAAVIQAEAGTQSYEGQLAVGAVIMNRVRSGGYPNSVSGVVTAPGQFPPATNGIVSGILSRGVHASCVQAAQDAINGSTNIGGFTHFRGAGNAVSGDSVVIGGHVFY